MNRLLGTAFNAAVEKKAIDPVVLDLREISGITDYFLICSGQSPVQVRAIADNIIDKIEELDLPSPQKEGYQDGVWVLLDFGTVVIHILQQREREFYGLEQLWHDAKVIGKSKFLGEQKAVNPPMGGNINE